MSSVEVVRHIYDVVNGLKKQGVNVTDKQVQLLIEKYENRSDMSFNAIITDIDRDVLGIKKQKQEHERLIQQVPNMKTLQNLPLEYNGITLNNQDIDLMMIACSESPIELQRALDKITNIRVSLGSLEMSDSDFIRVREEAYNMYLSSLSSREDSIRQPRLQFLRKIEYLKDSGILNDNEKQVLDDILSSSHSALEIVDGLERAFSDKVHQMMEIFKDFEPIEKEGISLMTIEKSRKLAEQLRDNYDSITIDEEAKYGKVTLLNGTFDFRHLSKALDFARDMGKQVRLNTLLFYMDCPTELYELPVTEQSRAVVKEKLMRYVDATTKFVRDNYGDVVRSVDVFNELLCRHSLMNSGAIVDRDGYNQSMVELGLDPNSPYYLRGQLPQDASLYRDFDNVNAGWMRHLSIEDLCDVIAVTRRNLPDVDFMYNDDHLTDASKMPATESLLRQIQEYEATHGIKLIDSIGTQMHIDNDLSKESIQNMFISLSKFGLPIEVTEFDMVMSSEIDGLTDKEIQAKRLEKIDEIHGIIEDLRSDCNIRGFTIWSKTDSQNFRVHLKNAERISQGLEPIKTLYGGFFGEDMDSKAKMFSKKQNFNYHTHTKRCGHAGSNSDEEYVAAAREQGIMRLGFSDHVPLSNLEYPDLLNKMHISEVDDYIISIDKLRDSNPDMEILCGFEAEYDPMKKGFLSELRGRVDYLILGQHYVKDGFKTIRAEANPYYPVLYADSVCEAMGTGLFDIVAHPDIFMKYRESMTSPEDRKTFDDSVVRAARKICETAADLGIPLEINLASVAKDEVMRDGNYSYPHPIFWQIAAEYDVKVLYGVDAHHPDQITEMEELINKVEKKIDVGDLTFVDDSYDPIVDRVKNPALSGLYEDSYSDSMTYESHLVYGLISTAVAGINGDITDNIGAVLEEGLMATSAVLPVEAEKRMDATRKKVNDIASSDMSPEAKAYVLERVGNEAKLIEETLSIRTAVIERAVDAVNSATMMGCETTEEYVQVVTDLTEVRSQSDMTKAHEASDRLVDFGEMKGSKSLSNMNTEQKSYVYTNNSSGGNAGFSGNDGGYAGSIILLISVLVLTILSVIALILFMR